ncbi:MAG: hypothetical protein H0U61_14730 [Nocardioidaceae bacterium]|nr:hypothetical protein [Nocardioidaceae bacterium]
MDPFDLPEWLGTEPVTWAATTPLTDGPLVTGQLTGPSGQVEPLDLMACDAAYPKPVLDEDERRKAHQAWQFGEVLLVAHEGRSTAAMPGSRFDANDACEVIRRVAKAVGASAPHFTVSIAL